MKLPTYDLWAIKKDLAGDDRESLGENLTRRKMAQQDA